MFLIVSNTWNIGEHLPVTVAQCFTCQPFVNVGLQLVLRTFSLVKCFFLMRPTNIAPLPLKNGETSKLDVGCLRKRSHSEHKSWTSSIFFIFSCFSFFFFLSFFLDDKTEKSSRSSCCKNDEFPLQKLIWGGFGGQEKGFGVAHLRVTSRFHVVHFLPHVFHSPFFSNQKSFSFSFFRFFLFPSFSDAEKGKNNRRKVLTAKMTIFLCENSKFGPW